MKKFAFLFLTVSLYSQPLYIHHSGTLNAYLIPADTLWREYIIPANTFIPDWMPHIIELVFFVHNYDYNLPDSSQWWVDNMEYRTGFIDSFEPDSATSGMYIYEPFGWWSTSSLTPDSSATSLNFGYSHPDTGTWDLIVSCIAPEHSVEMQDTVSIWLKAAQMSNLWDYIPLQTGNIWKWNVDEDLGPGNLWTIEYLFAYQSLGAFDRYYSQVWTQSSGGPHHMRLSLKKYEVYRDEKDKVYVNDIPIDFDLLPFENGDNDRYLLSESFQNVFIQQPFDVFNQPPFVKRYADSLLGSESYAYGIGNIYNYDGVTASKSLIGAKITNQEIGNLNIDNTVSVSLWDDENLFDRSFVKAIPPDSSWYRFSIPIWTFLPFTEDPDTTLDCDSIQISFEPEIFSAYDQYGRIVLDDVIITRGDSILLVVDDFETGLDRWSEVYALNDSYVYLDIIDDTPHDSSYNSMLIDFGIWSHPNFMGEVNTVLNCDPDFTLHS